MPGQQPLQPHRPSPSSVVRSNDPVDTLISALRTEVLPKLPDDERTRLQTQVDCAARFHELRSKLIERQGGILDELRLRITALRHALGAEDREGSA